MPHLASSPKSRGGGGGMFVLVLVLMDLLTIITVHYLNGILIIGTRLGVGKADEEV